LETNEELGAQIKSVLRGRCDIEGIGGIFLIILIVLLLTGRL
jgi:hypothetical protein